MIDKINGNRIKKIPVSIIGNKSDIGGKHTLRYANINSSKYTPVSLYTMSIKEESCYEYDNSIYSKWKDLFSSTSNECDLKNIYKPVEYLKKYIDSC